MQVENFPLSFNKKYLTVASYVLNWVNFFILGAIVTMGMVEYIQRSLYILAICFSLILALHIITFVLLCKNYYWEKQNSSLTIYGDRIRFYQNIYHPIEIKHEEIEVLYKGKYNTLRFKLNNGKKYSIFLNAYKDNDAKKIEEVLLTEAVI